MNTSTSSTLGMLNDLIQTCKDGQAGFRDAEQNIKNPEVKIFLGECSLQRSAFAGELQTAARELGDHDPADTTTVSADLHRGWLDLKAAIAGNDPHAILAECERGEDAAVSAYKAALEKERLPADVREVIQRQYIRVRATHDHVKELRDALKK